MKLHRSVIAIVFLVLFISVPERARTTSSAIQDFQASEGSGWTIHRSGNDRVRAMYGKGTGRVIADQRGAELFLSDYKELFGISDPSQLRLESIETDESGSSYTFGQYVSGIPVVGGNLGIHTNSQGHVVAVGGQFHSMKGLSTAASLERKAEAKATAERLRYSDGGVFDGTFTILPGFGEPRLAWKFDAFSYKSPGQWAIYVDAMLPHKVLRVQRQFLEADATGTVFAENPVVTPNVSNERFQHLKTSTTLNGKFTKIYNSNFQFPFPRNGDLSAFTTAVETDQDYSYPTSDSRFSEAMGYFHINVVHDRWRSFGFTKMNRQIPVFVNVASSSGRGFDNAFYTRGGRGTPFRNGAIVMGSGHTFENLGHDADVYYHEYGHAVLDRAKPQFFETTESNYPWAFHEGFSDISSSAITGNAKLAEFGLRSRTTGKHLGRNLENNNRFPQDVVLKSFGKSESHYTGLIIGGAWWDLQKQIGIDSAQRILHDSLAILPAEMNFFDLKASMVTADSRKNGGANAAAIESAFVKHGLAGADPGQPGTVELRSLKTARFNFDTWKFSIRNTFKRGDYIVVLATYQGTGLTPGYNLIPDLQVTGPQNALIDVFPVIDEAVNGLHSKKNGAWLGEISTYSGSATGEYTVSIRARLGGTSTVTDTKSVKFKITN